MKQVVREVELPVFSIEMDISECRFNSIEEIVAFIEEQVQTHKAAKYIATFNHMKHTCELPEGKVAEEIVAAYNIVFCFGFTLQDPEQLATRPRSIGICQSDGLITLSFVEAPMPVANALMEQWSRSLLLDNLSANQPIKGTPQQAYSLPKP
ncbi:MAG: hypothetical protein KZQ72_16525 [Candidatus Thiodiazotropha sp. (ex Cardiolucina cf. quadrata)]|nr:hypothetical protein [Candidatus Thiodiazotropha sp. (ex Cardiolucina cf. quadrata)]